MVCAVQVLRGDRVLDRAEGGDTQDSLMAHTWGARKTLKSDPTFLTRANEKELLVNEPGRSGGYK